MAARDQLKDPWSWLVAGISGGVGWAVVAGSATTAAAAAVGVGIGAVVMGAQLAVGAIRRPGPKAIEGTRPDRLPQPATGSPAGVLLMRGRTAVNRMRQLSQTPGDPWLRQNVANVDDEATEALKSLVDVGGRVTLVEQSYTPEDIPRLDAEVKRLTASVAATTDTDLKAEMQRALDAVQQRQVVTKRLDTLHTSLLTRMETAVVGLEGLAARMGEVIAIGATSVEHDKAAELISGLTDELETMRAGLDETRRLVAGEPDGLTS